VPIKYLSPELVFCFQLIFACNCACSSAGVNTYMAMQRLAAKHGYTGPVNGILGPNSYKGLARYFNTL